MPVPSCGGRRGCTCESCFTDPTADEWSAEAEHGGMERLRPDASVPTGSGRAPTLAGSLPPVLAAPAFHGLVGEIVEELAPATEADPAALLAVFLTCCGSAVGRGPHASVGATQHPGRLFVAIVGDTSRARKGTAFAEVRRIVSAADPAWAERICGGFGSGEAVVDEIRDTVADSEQLRDRRLLVRESELARILRTSGREGSVLSMMLRAAWDGDRLEARSRRATVTSTDAHLSVVADITAEELRRELSSVEIANGLGNRFMFIHAQRARLLPEGGGLPLERVAGFGRRLGETLQQFSRITRFSRTDAARERWADLYARLASCPAEGFVGALTARADAQALRLSVLYAGLDGTAEIRVEHIDAAEALWSYSQGTVEYLYGDRTGSTIADRLLAALERNSDGLTLTEQNKVFSGHCSKRDLDAARRLLETRGSAITVEQATAGRPSARTYFVPASERSEKSEPSQKGLANEWS